MKHIEIAGAGQNNLKSFDLKLPLKTFTVICGPSGSGKSSLAFETLFAEGQRHYTQTLSNYARQYIQELPRPLVKSIRHIPPALALEQKNTVRSARPTVATLTEVADFLRLLFTHAGTPLCPVHKLPLCAHSPAGGAKKIRQEFTGARGMICVPMYPSLMGLSPAELKKKLIQEGIRRLGVKDKRKKALDVREFTLSTKLPKKEFYLVLDRLSFTDEKRIADSLKSAYRLFLKYHKTRKAGEALVTGPKSQWFFSSSPLCAQCAYRFPLPLRTSLFNFNSSLGACPSCRGFGNHLSLDEKKVVPSPRKTLAQGALAPFAMPSAVAEFRQLKQFCLSQNIDLHCPWEALPPRHRKKIWNGTARFMGVKGFFDYLEGKKYKIHVRVFLSRYKSAVPCRECRGGRFRKEISHIVFREKTLPEIMTMDIGALRKFFQKLSLTAEEQKKVGEPVEKILLLLQGLCDIGLNYLKLNRLVRTLSSGEFQRLNLIHQLGLGLSQVLYVLDEPTVGLHSRDSFRLIELLKKLKSRGNTLVVVEHDPDVIREAEFIVELGPGAGLKGGHVVFADAGDVFLQSSTSPTGRYFAGGESRKKQSASLPVDPKTYKYFVEISGCKAHNLKNVHLRAPLNRLTVVTGVSGSGKSTLVSQTLYPALARFFARENPPKGHPYAELKGTGHLRQVVWMDSTPVEKTKKSLPVTYLKIYDSIRSLMADHCRGPGADLVRPGFFSLNVEGGRCSFCRGLGFQEIEMVFMDPVRIPCEECGGKRFKPEILGLKWRGKNIHQILNMTVERASDFFVSYPAVWKPLSLLKKVGLEYLLLGQALSTLSGGESQRLKLARELLRPAKNTLYILDEPTVGLHFQEVRLLLELLRDLIKKGASVLLVEHNMDLISEADYIIDMGPGAGPQGGKILEQGAPAELARRPKGATASLLKKRFQM